MNHAAFLTVLAMTIVLLPGQSARGQARIPPPAPGSTAVACHADEPGERMLVVGIVVDGGGRPIGGASVTLYNTDANGLYNPRSSPTRVPRIRAVVTSDDAGRFQVLTVRPAPYPDGGEPAHIHMEAQSAGYHPRSTALWFEDDPLVTPEKRREAERHSAEHPTDVTAVVPVERQGGVQVVRARVVLGEN